MIKTVKNLVRKKNKDCCLLSIMRNAKVEVNIKAKSARSKEWEKKSRQRKMMRSDRVYNSV